MRSNYYHIINVVVVKDTLTLNEYRQMYAINDTAVCYRMSNSTSSPDHTQRSRAVRPSALQSVSDKATTKSADSGSLVRPFVSSFTGKNPLR